MFDVLEGHHLTLTGCREQFQELWFQQRRERLGLGRPGLEGSMRVFLLYEKFPGDS